MGQFDNESYLRALDASRADIDRQVRNTLQEVNQQRGVALGSTRRITPTAKKAFGTATGDLEAQLGTIGSGLSELGVAQSVGDPRLQETRQENVANVKGGLASFARAQGLLGQGFREQALQRRGEVKGIGQELKSDVREKRQDYISRRQAEERQRKLQEELQRRQMQQQRAQMQQQAELQRAQLQQAAQLQRESIAAQQSIAQQQIAAQRAAAAASRSAAGAASSNRLFEARVSNLNAAIRQDPRPSNQKRVVESAYAQGFAPPGMSLVDFAREIGVTNRNLFRNVPKPSSRRGGLQL